MNLSMKKYYKIDDENECLMCLENVNVGKEHILCQTCFKYCHIQCYNNWKKFKKENKLSCIHCKEKTLLKYSNSRNCFLTFLLGPKYRYVKYT